MMPTPKSFFSFHFICIVLSVIEQFILCMSENATSFLLNCCMVIKNHITVRRFILGIPFEIHVSLVIGNYIRMCTQVPVQFFPINEHQNLLQWLLRQGSPLSFLPKWSSSNNKCTCYRRFFVKLSVCIKRTFVTWDSYQPNKVAFATGDLTSNFIHISLI